MDNGQWAIHEEGVIEDAQWTKDDERMTTRAIKTFRDLPVYKDAFHLQQQVFRLSRKWPREEAYSLTDQVRRSSRSIGANIAEAWAKRRYQAHFTMKLTDSDAELQETLHWLDTAVACEYVDEESAKRLTDAAESIGRQLGAIMRDAETFCK